MYCYNRAQAVVFAAEHDPQFLLIDFLTSRLERGFGFEGGLRVFGAFLLRHFKKDPRLLEALLQPFDSGDLPANLVELLERRLRGFLLIPEVWLA